MKGSNDNIRVVIPLNVRRRNGRPKILPPEDVLEQQTRAQAPHILKALGRAWAWRRRLESGNVATAGDLAKLEGVTERFVSRTIRLAYLSPQVLQDLLLARVPTALSLPDLIASTLLPWKTQSKNDIDSALPRRAGENSRISVLSQHFRDPAYSPLDC